MPWDLFYIKAGYLNQVIVGKISVLRADACRRGCDILVSKTCRASSVSKTGRLLAGTGEFGACGRSDFSVVDSWAPSFTS